MRSFSISYSANIRLSWLCALLAVALAVLVLTAPAAAKKKKSPDPEELFNPLLGIEYSHWLVGPIAEIADEAEVEEYLELVDDGEAASFIEAFWQRRNEGTGFFEETPQQLFEKRAEEADKRFTVGAFPGRRSDRGTIYILFGEPEEIDHPQPKKVGEPTLEVWKYPKDAAAGLGGEKPKTTYRFIRVGDQTFFYTAASAQRRAIEDRRHPRHPPPG